MSETIGDIGEKELIRSIIKPLLNPEDDPNAVGDDCAVVGSSEPTLFCISTDRVPADLVSFRTGIISYAGLGNYLAVLNLSDIAAMGAIPASLLLNLGLRSDMLVNDLIELLAGAKRACLDYGCKILGGDLSSASELSASATSFGRVAPSRILRRRGAHKGDLVYCGSPVGLTPTAFSYFLGVKSDRFSLSQVAEERLKDQFRSPRARFDVARVLSDIGGATAMDNTDGVGQTLSELAELNDLGIRIDADAVIVDDISRLVAEQSSCAPIELALSAGADFNLVGSIPRDADLSQLPSDVKIIGEFVEGDGVTLAMNGRVERLEVKGWNYFAR
jgi:thiamine-monophosphate kinase